MNGGFFKKVFASEPCIGEFIKVRPKDLFRFVVFNGEESESRNGSESLDVFFVYCVSRL